MGLAFTRVPLEMTPAVGLHGPNSISSIRRLRWLLHGFKFLICKILKCIQWRGHEFDRVRSFFLILDADVSRTGMDNLEIKYKNICIFLTGVHTAV